MLDESKYIKEEGVLLMKKTSFFLLVLTILFALTTVFAENWICPSCGESVSGNFCNNCGAAKPAGSWVCPSCGNTASGNFCSNCGTARNASTPTIKQPTATPAPTFTPVPCERNGDGYSVTQDYTWDTSWYHYFGMVIKNTSGSKCGFDAQVLFYDSDNNVLGVSNQSVDVCDSGYEVLITCSSNTAFDHVGYTITPTSTNYNDIHSYVSVSAQKAGKKAILIGSNYGVVDALFVEYRCLFLDADENVVGSSWGYLVDNSSKLKSGMTEIREESCSTAFESIVVYFEGRTNRSVVNTGTVELQPMEMNVAAGDGYLVTHEYAWGSSWYNYYALAIKNTSKTDCAFEVRILFYDKNENIIGVSNQSITVCGSGSEVLVKSSSSDDYDHVGYAVNVTESNYCDVHDSVSISTTISGKKAILTATNNGTQTAKFVEYHCLFLDKAGNVVDSGWGYLVDGQSELKPGNSEMREEQSSKNFDSVVVYFEGRRNK